MKHLIVTAALSIMLALPAVAQTTGPMTQQGTDTQDAAENAADRAKRIGDPTANTAERAITKQVRPGGATAAATWTKPTGDIRGSKLMGAEIINATNEHIGDVSDVVLDNAGRIQKVVVDPQGVLGGATKNVAIEFTKLQVLQAGDAFRLSTNLTAEQLKALPEYKANQSSAASASTSAGGGASSKTNEKK